MLTKYLVNVVSMNGDGARPELDELGPGIAALRAGDRAKVCDLIANVLRYNVDNLAAWQWLHKR